PDTTVSEYAVSLATIFTQNPGVANESEPLPLMQAYIENSDATALPKLSALSTTYAAITKALVTTPVPPSLATQHLALIQAFDTMAHATQAAASFNSDPVLVMGSLTVLPSSAQSVVDNLDAISQAILANGEPPTGTGGAYIVGVARAMQQAPQP